MILQFLKDRLTNDELQQIKDFYREGLYETAIGYNKTRKIYSDCPEIINKVLDENGFEFIQAIALNFYTPAWMHIDSIATASDPSEKLAVIVFPLDLETNAYNAALGNEYPKLLITEQSHPTIRGAFLVGDVDQYIVDKVSADNPKNVMITDYSILDNVSDKPFPVDVWFDRYRYMPYESFKGLSIYDEFEWKPGNVMIVDKSNVHAASGFNHLGISKKTLVIVNGRLKNQ